MLWIEGSLSNLERLAIHSFLECGHPLNLYSYESNLSVPDGVTLCDANKVVAGNQRFRNQTAIGKGSWGPFSDLFRFSLLYEQGGVWCDTDLVCLKPIDFKGNQVILASEYVLVTSPGGGAANPLPTTCFIAAPAKDPFIAECLRMTSSIGRTQNNWAESGPGVVRTLVAEHGHMVSVLHPDIFCSMPHWDIHRLVSGFSSINPTAYGLHFWNEIWRWNFLDKNAAYDPLSIYERLKSHYLERAS